MFYTYKDRMIEALLLMEAFEHSLVSSVRDVVACVLWVGGIEGIQEGSGPQLTEGYDQNLYNN